MVAGGCLVVDAVGHIGMFWMTTTNSIEGAYVLCMGNTQVAYKVCMCVCDGIIRLLVGRMQQLRRYRPCVCL